MNEKKAGVILSYIGIVANVLVNFLFVPALISFLGKEQFGLYQLVGAMIAYLNIMDFGLSNATTRYYSRYTAQGKEKEKENLLFLTSALYCFISILIVIVGYVGFDLVIPFYQESLSTQDIECVRQMFYILLINVAIVIPSNVFIAVINSHQKFIFSRSVIIFTAVFRPLFVLLCLLLVNNIMTVVVVQTLFNIAVAGVNAWFALSVLHAKFKFHFWDGKLVKEILRYSFFVFLPGIITIAYWQTGQVILGAVIGAGAVAVYATAVQVANGYMALANSISSVFLPQLSAISAKTEDMTQINDIFIRNSRLQFFLMSLLLAGFALYGREFVQLWLGNGFQNTYIYALILMSGLFVCLVQTTAVVAIQAKNKHAFRSTVYFFLGLLNILLSIPMAKKYGGLGCAMTTGFCLLLGQTIIMNIYYYKIGLAVMRFIKNVLQMSPAVLLAVLWGVLVQLVWPCRSLWAFLIQGFLFSVIFVVFSWKMAMNEYEKNLVLNPLRKLKLIYDNHYR